ncbi:hypothetical protein AB0I35_25350 [Nocardia sp. NPDC050378]|uniref:hypothetical protein n=1 Tax=Nocardia sp. NPDC050378 TaxID=3155400 RepID=UPI0033FC9FE2
MDPNLDPDVAAYLSVALSAVADLATASKQLENLTFDDIVTPQTVDAAFLDAWAARSDSSPEFQRCAQLVATGAYKWEDVERWAVPFPPELAEMRNSPSYLWTFPKADSHPGTFEEHGFSGSEPGFSRPIKGGRNDVVGPSDWSDDDDEYTEIRSWLV